MQAAFGRNNTVTIQDIARPAVPPGHLLVKVAFAGLNRADCLQRRGLYPPPMGVTEVLGLELAGTVVEVASDVPDWQVGTRLCALVQGGAMAEYCAVDASLAIRVPDAMPLDVAASFAETYGTVYDNVVSKAKLQAGETLLVHGGTSGIGMAAIEIAKDIGAHVVVTVGSEEKVAAALQRGASAAINYREHDFATVMTSRFPQGADVIVDIIGASYVEQNMRALAEEGRWIVLALMGGHTAPLSLATLMRKRATIMGSTLRSTPLAYRAALARTLEETIIPKIMDGTYSITIDTIGRLQELASLQAYMESSQHMGKIVVQINGTEARKSLA